LSSHHIHCPLASSSAQQDYQKATNQQLVSYCWVLSLNQVDEHYYQMKNMTKPMASVVSPNKAIQAQHLSLVADATNCSSLTTKTNLETIATSSYIGGIYYRELTL
jgi:hypothetical protein